MAQTIFITGASTGLGRATALLFAARGWTVIATMRNPDKEAELGAVKGITLLPLDVTDPAQIVGELRVEESADLVAETRVVIAPGYSHGAGPPRADSELYWSGQIVPDAESV